MLFLKAQMEILNVLDTDTVSARELASRYKIEKTQAAKKRLERNGSVVTMCSHGFNWYYELLLKGPA